MTRIDDITTTLRSLDPADQQIDPASTRARADLHAILATEPTPSHPHTPAPSPKAAARPSHTRRTIGRIALAGGLVAAVTTGVVVLPPLTGGDQAFATWTASPTILPGQDVPEAGAGCRDSLMKGGDEYAKDLRAARTVIAERRGEWTTVVLAGTEGFSALCITDDSVRLFDQAMIGSLGRPTNNTSPHPRELIATSLGVGAMSAGEISLAAGTAGTDIVGVVYRSPTHGDVRATVSEGHFALWLPGNALENASSHGVDVDVTYRDGTTGTTQLSF